MDEYEENRVFVGGLSWEMDDRGLEDCFRRFGKVIEAKVMRERETGRPRGFGFVTFADKRSMEDAIEKLHDRELDGRVVSVTKAQPKMWSGGGKGGGGGAGGGFRDDYPPPKGGYGGKGGGGREDCFNCGQPGHWARDCPNARFGRGDRYGGGSGGGRDRYGSGSGYGGRYGGHDYGGERGYGGDRGYGSERGYGGDRGYDRYSSRDYGGDRQYDRYDDGYGREGRYADRDGGRERYGRDRYGSGGPARYEGRYKDRPAPYDRPSGGRSVYDSRY